MKLIKSFLVALLVCVVGYGIGQLPMRVLFIVFMAVPSFALLWFIVYYIMFGPQYGDAHE